MYLIRNRLLNLIENLMESSLSYSGRVGRRNFTSSLSQTPYVNLSIHTAPGNLTRLAFQHDVDAFAAVPPFRLTYIRRKLPHPLRSEIITTPSTLIRDDPPPMLVLILSPFVDFTYRVFSYHPTQGSHVPRRSPD